LLPVLVYFERYPGLSESLANGRAPSLVLTSPDALQLFRSGIRFRKFTHQIHVTVGARLIDLPDDSLGFVSRKFTSGSIRLPFTIRPRTKPILACHHALGVISLTQRCFAPNAEPNTVLDSIDAVPEEVGVEVSEYGLITPSFKSLYRKRDSTDVLVRGLAL
jgi:hypothetical protein